MRNKILLGLLLSSIAAFSAEPPHVGKTWTNRVERILSIIGTQPLSGKCPECGELNHHVRELRLMQAEENIYSQLVFDGKTNEVHVGVGVSTNWVSTNIVFRMNPRQPGWGSVPPLPRSTNVISNP